MKQAEFWLLDVLVDRWFALQWLTQPDLEARINRAGHGLSFEALAKTMQRLFKQGDLVAQRLRLQPRCALVGDDFVPTPQQVEAGLRGESPLACWLTTRGGRRWEAYACPDWQHYLRCAVPAGQQGEIIGSDRTVVQQHLALLQEHSTGAVVAGSEQWDTLMPWEATYWKVLSVGHRVRFRITRRGQQFAAWDSEPFTTALQQWRRRQPA
jgi:hypothetical protein